ncbi:MAG: FkbM family methyltransferase [Albidovulum sp.]
MKQVCGIWLPDGDRHFEGQLSGATLIKGKATYQYGKYLAAMKFVRTRNHACDIGAHVGLWSRVMSFDFRRVTAFEPLAAHRDCFARNVDAGNVTLHGLALGAAAGTIRVHMPEDNTGNAHVGDEGEPVAMVALDEFGHLEQIDFLKIDVEGFELDVVTGAEKIIRSHRPVMVVEQKPNNAERYGRGRWDAVNVLKSWGMKEMAVISGDHVMTW